VELIIRGLDQLVLSPMNKTHLFWMQMHHKVVNISAL
jgi:hypothetical protein